MAAKLTRPIYQIAIRRNVASESCRLITFCCRFWRWVLRLLSTLSCDNNEEDTVCDLWWILSSVKFGTWGFHGDVWRHVIW